MSSIKYLKSISALARPDIDKVNLYWENILFRLHSNFTAALLIGASTLLGVTEFFGKPIRCIADLPTNVIETYCWVTSTFTISDYFYREVGEQMAQPGVGPAGTGAYMTDEEMASKWTFHNYYQWVVIFLFFQAGCFYLPRLIWNHLEGGLIQKLSESLLRNTIIKEDSVSIKKNQVTDYILTHINLHNRFALKYFFCEFLSFFNIILQLFLVDKFLGGEFLTYGTKVLEYANQEQETRVDPMIYVFPRTTKCRFFLYGPSGSMQTRDSLCLLPQNILNEKVFIFMWFWFLALGTCLGLLMIYRIIMVFLPKLRSLLLHISNKSIPVESIEVITKKTSFGDWWVLYCLSNIIDPAVYRDILIRISKEIETNVSNKPNYYSNGHASAPTLYCQSTV